MEVSINLLPQSNSRKEKKSVYLIPTLGIITFLAASSLLTYNYLDTKDSINSLTEKIADQTSARDSVLNDLNERTTGVNEFNYIEKYREMNQILKSVYKSAIDLQDGVLKLLPEKATVKSYAYLNNGDLTLTISSYSKGDSAVFLHRLQSEEFIEDASLESISANDENLTYESIIHIKLKTLAGEK